MGTNADAHTDEESEEFDLVPEGVIEGVEEARDGEFATKESLDDALFSEE